MKTMNALMALFVSLTPFGVVAHHMESTTPAMADSSASLFGIHPLLAFALLLVSIIALQRGITGAINHWQTDRDQRG